MRIVLITAHYPPALVPCGVGDYTRCLRAALADGGNSTVAITSVRSHAGEPDTFCVADRWGPGDLLRVFRLIRRERPDVVLLQYTPEHYGFGFAFKLLPLLVRAGAGDSRFITTFHTLVGGRRRARVSALLLAAGSHGAVSTHEELTGLFRRRLPWWRHKLREIPIGANIPLSDLPRPEAARRLRARLAVNGSVPLVACFGFPGRGKGMDVLLRSAAAASAPFHLVFVAKVREEDRPDRRDLEALAEDLGIGVRVHWLDALPHEEAARALAGCDLHAVPYDDGVSLRRGTLMAGWQQGLAVITTTPRTPSDVFADGDTVLLVPPRDPGALAAAIGRVLQDRDLRRRLEAGALRVRARFGWDAIAAAHLGFARDLGVREAA